MEGDFRARVRRHHYHGSDWAFYLGTIGLFLTLFYLVIRVLPMISIFEMRELVHRSKPGRHVETMETSAD